MFITKDTKAKQTYIDLIETVKKLSVENKKMIAEKKSIEGKISNSSKIKGLSHRIRNISDSTKALPEKVKIIGTREAAKHVIVNRIRRNDSLSDVNLHNDLNKIPINYFSKERIAVYTCIIGNYDNLIEPAFCPDNCDLYAVTNFDIPTNSKWKRINPKDYNLDPNLTNAEVNRYFKMLPQNFLSNYRYSVYIDGNIKLFTDATEFVNRISNYGVGFFKHALRNSVYCEAETCFAYGKADRTSIERYVKDMRSKQMPNDYGLIQCSVIARDHSSEICNKIMEEWWKMFLNGEIKRDQLLLPYVLFKKNISIDDVCTLGNNVWEYPGLETLSHK